MSHLQATNTIDIPGYLPVVDYGSNFGHECILQATYHFSWGYEIAFYNRRPNDIGDGNSNVAVWRIKERH